MADFLAHPLILLLFGALVSGLLIPEITRRWQIGQKALEIKIGLVGDLSETIMDMVTSIHFVQLGANSMGNQEFDHAYQTWVVRSAGVDARLRAYFPGTEIPDEWSKFSEIVTPIYDSVCAEEDKKPEIASKIGEKISIQSGSPHRGIEDWDTLKKRIFEKKARLIRNVLSSEISVLTADGSGTGLLRRLKRSVGHIVK